MKEILFNILMMIVVNSSEPDKSKRMDILAQSIDSGVSRVACVGKWENDNCRKYWHGKPKYLAVAMLAQGKSETRFSERIHKGFCRPDECDPYPCLKDGKWGVCFKARNVFQVHSSPKMKKFWEKALGSSLEATTNAAYIQAYYLAVRQCRGNVVKMFESQNGRGCKTGSLGEKKAALYWKYLSIYNKLEKQAQ